MNIAVLTQEGKVYCRPDTTWERENKDLFVPDRVGSYLSAPVVFVRICKAGKCIGARFADRYYDCVNFGALLYVGDEMDGGAESLACASCHDHSSILPFPLFSKVTLDKSDNEFTFEKDGKTVFRTEVGTGMRGTIENALVRCSEVVSLRIGDYVAVELDTARPLVGRDEKKVLLSGTFCENSTFDFNVIF